MEGAISDISATPTREAGSCSTTVTSQGKMMFCIPKLENQDATPVRYQEKAWAGCRTIHRPYHA